MKNVNNDYGESRKEAKKSTFPFTFLENYFTPPKEPFARIFILQYLNLFPFSDVSTCSP